VDPVVLVCLLTRMVFACTFHSMQAFMVYNFVQLLITYFTPYATEEVRIKHLEALLSKVDKVKAKPPCCCMGLLHPGKYATR